MSNVVAIFASTTTNRLLIWLILNLCLAAFHRNSSFVSNELIVIGNMQFEQCPFAGCFYTHAAVSPIYVPFSRRSGRSPSTHIYFASHTLCAEMNSMPIRLGIFQFILYSIYWLHLFSLSLYIWSAFYMLLIMHFIVFYFQRSFLFFISFVFCKIYIIIIYYFTLLFIYLVRIYRVFFCNGIFILSVGHMLQVLPVLLSSVNI